MFGRRFIPLSTHLKYKNQNRRLFITLSGSGAYLLYNRYSNAVGCTANEETGIGDESRKKDNSAFDENNTTSNDKDENEDNSMNLFIDKVVGLVGPLILRLGIGGMMGVSSGYAVKRLGKDVLYGVGIIFITAQTFAYMGWLTIHYKKIGYDMIRLFDADGDGLVTLKDIKVYVRYLFRVLTYGLPTTASFALGFSLGFKL